MIEIFVFLVGLAAYVAFLYYIAMHPRKLFVEARKILLENINSSVEIPFQKNKKVWKCPEDYAHSILGNKRKVILLCIGKAALCFFVWLTIGGLLSMPSIHSLTGQSAAWLSPHIYYGLSWVGCILMPRFYFYHLRAFSSYMRKRKKIRKRTHDEQMIQEGIQKYGNTH